MSKLGFEVNRRLNKLAAQFDNNRIDAFLVTKDINITYLTSFPASESWLLVAPCKAFYITDFRYVTEVKNNLKGVALRQYTQSMAQTLFQAVASQGVRRLGFDPRHLTLALYRQLSRECPKHIKLVAVEYLIENLRAVKEKNEIESIRRALAIHKDALRYLKGVIRPGVKESEVLLKLENFVRARKAGFSFDPIIACGPHSSLPHARVSERKIAANDTVLVDFGVDVNGYKSDLTRMFFLGKIPPLVRKVNDIVAVAQHKAIGKIRADVAAAEVDEEARNHIAVNKFGKNFGHSLGHGVGLEIHEGPRLAPTSKHVLEAGMVVTVEPAIYIANQFGIRIEDMVLVRKNGCEVLSEGI